MTVVAIFLSVIDLCTMLWDPFCLDSFLWLANPGFHHGLGTCFTSIMLQIFETSLWLRHCSQRVFSQWMWRGTGPHWLSVMWAWNALSIIPVCLVSLLTHPVIPRSIKPLHCFVSCYPTLSNHLIVRRGLSMLPCGNGWFHTGEAVTLNGLSHV